MLLKTCSRCTAGVIALASQDGLQASDRQCCSTGGRCSNEVDLGDLRNVVVRRKPGWNGKYAQRLTAETLCRYLNFKPANSEAAWNLHSSA